MITQARLKELFHYDPETGDFTRLIARRGCDKVGDIAGTLSTTDGYVQIGIDRKIYFAHRLAWLYQTGAWPQCQIDHRDCNPVNNAWSNLREATGTQNTANTSLRRDNQLGLKGVCRNGSGYRALIRIDGKQRYLGTYATPEQAHIVYMQEAKRLFGEFARAM